MAVRRIFDSSRHSTVRPAEILGVSRGFVGRPANLLGTNDETVYLTDFESILSLSELAARLGVSAQTIYGLRSHGRGPHGFRIGRQLKSRASEVDAWLRRLEEDDVRRPGEADGERRAPAHGHRHLRHRRHPIEGSRLHPHGPVPRR